MFKVLIVGLFAVGCYAIPNGWGLSSGYGNSGGYGGGDWSGAKVSAAILSSRNIKVVPVKSNYGSAAPTVVDIDSSEQPVVLNFNSRSSRLDVNQNHIGQKGSIQQSSSVDEANILRHEVTRPVLQEIREIIVPQRSIIQEIRPVIENVQTLVARGEGNGGNGGNGGLGLGGGLGGGLILGGDGIGLGRGLGGGLGDGLGGGYGGIGGGYGGIGGGYGGLELGGGKVLRLSKGY